MATSPRHWPVPDALAYLAGSGGVWHVERDVSDHLARQEGRFTGETRFTAREDGPGLTQHESGRFTWLGRTGPAERTLQFLPGEQAGTVDVRFGDGRPFHDLDLRHGHHLAGHPCAADHYRGEFEVLGPHRWRTVWRVSGPAKDLRLVTEYLRRTDRFPG
ncbi:DUF6314 family protein [Streptomyces sp. NPDC059740]|uniref:DUF6314 family protein n=1 Tax=Streptomyces sp. NPDC059740 TaxID=3346926 RepID=UPI0036591A24